DVKPSNVMLVTVGGVGALETVKLFDFGIASNERAAMKLTVPGTAFGTPEYIAPEQAKGEKVDGRADLYGVAVVLFEMLCGRLPFVCKDDIAYLRAHIKEPPPAPSSVAPDARISRAVDALVLRALEKDPERRFADANAMIAAIDAAAGHKPLESRGRGHIVWVALLLVLLAVLFIAGARLLGAG
ncbi:MAG TPA: protein kinase, partial [Polyangia bacterium]